MITQEEIYHHIFQTKSGLPIPFDINQYLKRDGTITSFYGWVLARRNPRTPKIIKHTRNQKREKKEIRWRTMPVTIMNPISEQIRDIIPVQILKFNNQTVID